MSILYKVIFNFLLMMWASSIVSTDKFPDCLTCIIPCRKSDQNRSSLTKLFSNHVNSYTISTILDGYEGNFKVIISENSNNNRIYSGKINVAYWYFSTLCKILCEDPVITPVVNDSTQVKVHFPSFRLFFANLQSPEDSIASLFYTKVNLLQRDVSTYNEILTNTDNELSITKSELSMTRNELNVSNERLSLVENELSDLKTEFSNAKNELSETRNQLFKVTNDLRSVNQTYQAERTISRLCSNDLAAVLVNARISAYGWYCSPSSTNIIVSPSGLNYCRVPVNSYVYFDLRDVHIINVIRFKLWDGDSRIYTYTLDISNENGPWISLAAGVTGQSTQEYRLEEPTGVRTIRMDGYSTSNAYLHLISFAIDCI